MAKREVLTKDQILERISSAEIRAKMLDLLDLRSFLLHCIIRANYKVPEALSSCIVLSPYGEELLREMGKKGVPIKEGRVICLLELYHLDLLVDVDAIDLSALSDVIGHELTAGNVLLPFVHGPLLYEKSAELFPDERAHLGVNDTLRLLEGTPCGIFQMGRRLSGPYGILWSDEARVFRPRTSIPLMHCHDVACFTVLHSICYGHHGPH